ncbi:MAG: NUDIX domain-containing protein, partial [Alphaproteobacteria bacterium]
MTAPLAGTPNLTREDVEVLEKTTVWKGRFQIDRYKLRHKLHDGGWSEPFIREVFERGHAAAVLPYDPIRDLVVLIELFRPGAYAAGRHPWLVEVVAGIIDPGEAVENVVRREAWEEAHV